MDGCTGFNKTSPSHLVVKAAECSQCRLRSDAVAVLWFLCQSSSRYAAPYHQPVLAWHRVV